MAWLGIKNWAVWPFDEICRSVDMWHFDATKREVCLTASRWSWTTDRREVRLELKLKRLPSRVSWSICRLCHDLVLGCRPQRWCCDISYFGSKDEGVFLWTTLPPKSLWGLMIWMNQVKEMYSTGGLPNDMRWLIILGDDVYVNTARLYYFLAGHASRDDHPVIFAHAPCRQSYKILLFPMTFCISVLSAVS